eukprot:gnl/TRDRNA2_/TRDRNA2_130047_c0_seq1.p2 gnl/TRDRNA2_/TRDRNA2_130047_c0~~gnl/TRDRNA2_/TRDRNA2_130047_c0_seq1.p2  ORF type:complete len:176 (-),score=64.80 gnl/TRDRNA2_/TRDRNA2_130047_c0_seq1:436-963(-)
MAEATPEVLKSFPWPTQAEITARKEKLKLITGKLFAAAAEKGTQDVDAVLKGNEELRAAVRASLTDDKKLSEIASEWSGLDLQKELAARQRDKEKEEAKQKEHEEEVAERRAAERKLKEEEARLAEEERLKGKNPPKAAEKKAPSSSSEEEDYNYTGARRKTQVKKDTKKSPTAC